MMKKTTRNRWAWATNALSVAILIAIGTWTVEQRKDQQAALARAEVVADAIYHSSTAVIAVDGEGRITEWNEAAEELTGFEGSVAIGQRPDLIIPEEHQERHNNGLAKALETGRLAKQVQQVHCEIETQKGERIPVVVSLRAVDTPSVKFIATMDAADQVVELKPDEPKKEASDVPKDSRPDNGLHTIR